MSIVVVGEGALLQRSEHMPHHTHSTFPKRFFPTPMHSPALSCFFPLHARFVCLYLHIFFLFLDTPQNKLFLPRLSYRHVLPQSFIATGTRGEQPSLCLNGQSTEPAFLGLILNALRTPLWHRDKTRDQSSAPPWCVYHFSVSLPPSSLLPPSDSTNGGPNAVDSVPASTSCFISNQSNRVLWM